MIKCTKKWLGIVFVLVIAIGATALYADVDWTANSPGPAIADGGPKTETDSSISQSGWATNAPIPVIGGISQTATVAAEGLIYVIGGSLADGITQTDQVWAYDPSKDSWKRVADIPVKGGIRLYGAAVSSPALKGLIYVFGGVTLLSPQKIQVHDTTWIYDTVGDVWYQGADMPGPRFGSAVALVGTKVIVAGGSDGMQVTNTTWEYDAEADTYTVKAPMPAESFRIHGAAVRTDRSTEVHVFAGGFDGRNHLVYDVVNNMWRNGRPMPLLGVTDPAVINVNGLIYVIGGTPRTNVPAAPPAGVFTGIAQIYDPSNDRWILEPEIMPGPVNNTSGDVLDGTIYVIGGYNGTTPVATNYSLNVKK